MITRTSFARSEWDPSDFRYIYSPKCRDLPEFVQEDDCIVNRGGPEAGTYDYVSMITRRKLLSGTAITTHCSFEKYGAPLIVLTDDVRRGKTGELRFGFHMEIVAYENGVNVWHLEPKPGDVKAEAIRREKFTVPAGKIITLTVRPMGKKLEITLDNYSFTVETDYLPQKFYAGITACEGINRFYDFVTDEA